MTSKDIEKALNRKYCNARYIVPNVYFFGYGYGETDYLVVTTAGIIMDIEVKISTADFKRDFLKTGKHEELKFGKINKYRPNKFWFAVPKGLIKVEDVPDYAGLIYVDEFGRAEEVKKAPYLHRDKIPYAERLVDKFYYGYREAIALREESGVKILEAEIRQLKKTNDQLQKNIFDANKYIREHERGEVIMELKREIREWEERFKNLQIN